MSEKRYPYIVCHMMSSIDGKIASGDEDSILGDFFNLYMQTESFYKANAWMFGRVTMEMFASGDLSVLPNEHQEINDDSYIVSPMSELYLLGVDTKGVLRWDRNSVKFENVKDELNLIIIVTKSTPKKYLAYLRMKNISYIVAGDDEIDFDYLFSFIKEILRVDTLLLEGGGLLNGSVLAAGFIDEISLLFTPIVANRSKAPSLFERVTKEPLKITKFKFSDVQKLENDCIVLKYKRIP